MAVYSAGITVTFNNITISQVTGLSWSVGGGVPTNRSSGGWYPEMGSVTVESLGGIVGTRGQGATIRITGGGMGLTAFAVLTEYGASAEVNGVTRYSHSFTLIE